MSIHNDTKNIHKDTVSTCPDFRDPSGGLKSDEKRPSDGQTIYNIFLGVAKEGDYRERVLRGYYTIRSMGHVVDDPDDPKGPQKDSPCWVWKGSMRKGRPILRTWLSSYSPRSLLLKRMGLRGRSRMMCTTPGCIRPHHMLLETPQEVMAHARKHLKPKARDPKTGRFLPAGSPHPPEHKGP